MRTLLLLFLIVLQTLSLSAQSKKMTYTVKKGQVFDILLLTLKPDTKAQLKNYFQTFSPIAKKHGYHSLKEFPIKESPTQGNYQPQSMILGYWDNLDLREKFLQYVESKKMNFHQQRRDIWFHFDVTYYQAKQDYTFEVDRQKYNVVTAYWHKNKRGFKHFKQKWNEKVRQAGGTIKVAFIEGASPFGYHYNPDYLTITAWENKATFEKFYKQNLAMDHSAVQQVNQFKIF